MYNNIFDYQRDKMSLEIGLPASFESCYNVMLILKFSYLDFISVSFLLFFTCRLERVPVQRCIHKQNTVRIIQGRSRSKVFRGLIVIPSALSDIENPTLVEANAPKKIFRNLKSKID